jgi:hypothetical protein
MTGKTPCMLCQSIYNHQPRRNLTSFAAASLATTLIQSHIWALLLTVYKLGFHIPFIFLIGAQRDW